MIFKYLGGTIGGARINGSTLKKGDTVGVYGSGADYEIDAESIERIAKRADLEGINEEVTEDDG